MPDMRLAFVDLFFSWPPHGGADADLFHTVSALQALGHEVRVFVASCEESWERGSVDPAAMPFPLIKLGFSRKEINRREMPARFREAVDAWKPDAVFVCDGFFLKPYVTEALAHYPLAARYYAYEVACPRDFRLFRDGAPCPMNYLRTPNVCRPCALKGMAAEIKHWKPLSWGEEYLKARAYLPAYYARLTGSLQLYRTIIVYNRIQQRHFAGLHSDVRVVPGGVNIDEFACVPPIEKPRKVILMTGRVEDPSKGLDTLLAACGELASQRSDFELRATHTNLSLVSGWFKPIGWHPHSAMVKFYQEADICVFPSIWEEPFGLVAVEAMASGRPVCVSRTGGLQDIVVHGETGFIFERGNSAELAGHLARLLDDASLRQRMGQAARKRAEIEYDWRRIVETHYLPILERLKEKG